MAATASDSSNTNTTPSAASCSLPQEPGGGGPASPSPSASASASLSATPSPAPPAVLLLLPEAYVGCMVLGAVGDALGYYGGRWEFMKSGAQIHAELSEMTRGAGVPALALYGRDWRVSDDTVMHLATAEALATGAEGNELYQCIAARYVVCWKDMGGRAPGMSCLTGVKRLLADGSNWAESAFNPTAGGCGAAMRAMCIGLKYPLASQLQSLVACAVESGRITHHSPSGYLGAVAAAVFTAYAIQKVPVIDWGWKLLEEVIPVAKEHIVNSRRSVERNLALFGYFQKKWSDYLELRCITKANKTGPTFPAKWGVEERDYFYQSVSYSGWGGSSGHDAPLIAYDSLLWAKDNWEQLCLAGMLHGGDSDSTGTIAGALWGAVYGLSKVPERNYMYVEYVDRAASLALEIGRASHPDFAAQEALMPGNMSLRPTLHGI
ncbi:ADP-ribosylarginine hydrolase [Pelomyxa schiedti]|nr:ADP-ribosylarginine hydrolase [Pelomyxa schiedti]